LEREKARTRIRVNVTRENECYKEEEERITTRRKKKATRRREKDMCEKV